MICPKCGKKFPEKSRFCSEDGTLLISEDAIESDAAAPEPKAETAVAVPEAAEKHDEEAKHEVPPVEPKSSHHAEAQSAVKPKIKQAAGTDTKADPKETTQKNSSSAANKNPVLKKAIAGVLSIVLVFGLVFGVKSIISGRGSGVGCVIEAEGIYSYIPSVEKDKTNPIDRSRSDDSNVNVQFSPDGEYAYYITRADGTYGTLCRVKLDKLKQDMERNEKNIEVIASNVFYDFTVLEDNTLIYLTDNLDIFYFDGAESQLLAENVSLYFVDGKRVLYTTEGGATWQGLQEPMYAVSCENPHDSLRISTELDEILNHEDFDHILLCRYDETMEKSSLILTNFKGEEQVLLENLSGPVHTYSLLNHTSNGKHECYVQVTNEEKISPLDYVNDTSAEADADIQQPDKNDYLITAHKLDWIHRDDLEKVDPDALYTNCIAGLSWFPRKPNSWSLNYYSMQDAVDGVFELPPEVREAFSQFVSKHKDDGDKAGSFPVTEEVKKELQDIMALVPDAGESDWMMLCYQVYQSGKTLDKDRYQAAYDIWVEATARKKLRQRLKTEDNALTSGTLYSLDAGELTVVCEDVMYLDRAGNSSAIVYSGASDLELHSIDIDDMSSDFSVKDMFASNRARKHLLTCGTDYTVDENMDLEILQDCSISVFPNFMLFNSYSGGIDKASIIDGVIGVPTPISSDAWITFRDESTVYYTGDFYSVDYNEYGTLFAMDSDGNITKIMDDIGKESTTTFFEDGTIIALESTPGDSGITVYRGSDAGGNVTITGDITQYTRLDEHTLMYCTEDGDLILYDLNESDPLEASHTVSIGVNQFWTINRVEPMNFYFGK